MLDKYKSQAAIEFLSTYGWALLVLVLAVGVFFLMVRPGGMFVDSINFGSGIDSPHFSYAYFEFDDIKLGSFEIYIKNEMGSEMKEVTLTIDECENNKGKTSKKFDLLPDDIYKIILTCENIETTMDSQNKFHGVLDYTRETQGQVIEHSRRGELIVKPSQIVKFPDNNKGRKAFALRNNASGKNDENRFFPCDNIPGCENIDSTGVLKQLYGGYVDSMTGIVWSNESIQNDLVWSIRDSKDIRWDSIYYKWDYNTESYSRCDTCGSLAFRNDDIGSAFKYCTELEEMGRFDWKLPSLNDYSGITKCNQCLPPYGLYQDTYSLDSLKTYWTQTEYGDPTQGKAVAIAFVDGYDTIVGRSRDLQSAVRCIRDNP